MARVVHVLKNMGLGGTEKTAEIFARELKARGHDVFVIYNTRGDLTRMPHFQAFLDEQHLIGYDVEPQGTQQLRYLKPDIVHVYRGGMPEWPVPGRDTHSRSSFIETNVFGFIDPNPMVERSLFMSEWLMNNPIGTGPLPDLPRFDFVNNPIDKPVTEEKLAIDAPRHALIIGRCGRPDDGIYDPISVEAAVKMKTTGPLVHFVVVAPPPRMLADLERHEIPHTVIEPTTDPVELSKFYNCLDVYAHARADGETFGCNIAEAMMHGLPVVTHVAKPSHPGMGVFQSQTTLVDNMKTGIVCDDVDMYASALMGLRDKRTRKRMGDAGREKAEAEYETSVVVDKLERIYSEVM